MKGGALELAPGEAAEYQIDAFIARRSEARGHPEREREEMYAESVRRYNAGLRERYLWERLRAAEDRIRAHRATFAVLVAAHEQEASRCRMALGLTKLEDESKGAA